MALLDNLTQAYSNILGGVGNTLSNAGKPGGFLYNVAQPFAAAQPVAQGVVNFASNLAKEPFNIGQDIPNFIAYPFLTGQQLPYSNLKSASGKATYNILGGVENAISPQSSFGFNKGYNDTPQEFIKNTSQATIGLAPFVSGGTASDIVGMAKTNPMMAFYNAVLRGLPLSAVYGEGSALAGQDINQPLSKFLLSAQPKAALNTGIGVLASGAFGVVGNQFNSNPYQADLQKAIDSGKLQPQEAVQMGWQPPSQLGQQTQQALLDQRGFVKIPGSVNPTQQDLATGVQSGNLAPEEAQQLGLKERGFVTSVKGSPEVSPTVQAQVSGTYPPKPNSELIANTSDLLDKGLPKATNKVLGDMSVKAGTISDQTVSDAIGVAKAQDAAGNTDQATQIYNQLAAHLTAAGKEVQAASLLGNRTPQGLMYSAVKTLQEAKVPVTPDIQANLDGLVGVIKDTAPNTPERSIASQQLINFVNSNIPRSKIGLITGIWKTGLLTGPETVAKVSVSHAVTTPAELVSQIPASLADRIMSLITGERSLSATMQGGGTGLQEGFSAIEPKITQGIDMPGTGGFSSDFGSNTGRTGYENFIGNLHGALPKPAFAMRYNISLNDQALTEAVNQGLSGADKTNFVQDFLANPPQKALDVANWDAQVATNMEQTSVGKVASAIQGLKFGNIPVGQLLAPFTRVPSAIGVNGIYRYTPFGISGEVYQQISSGVFNQRTMAQAFGRSATGSTVVALGALLMGKGMMTLSAPSDPKERALWDVQHKIPNAIKLAGTWVSLNALGPLGIVLGVGGGFQQSLQQNSGSVVKGVEGALLAGGKVLADQPYLKGISGFANAVKDPTRYGLSWFDSTAGSVVPAMVSQIARGSDTVQRMYAKDLAGKFASEIPGFRQTLPPQRDLYGNTIPGSNPSGTIPGAVLGTINPFYPSKAASDPVSSELQRLYDSLGPTDAPNISQMSPSQTVYGQKVKLTNQQISDVVASSGPQIQQALTGLMSSPAYSQLNDLQKSKVITNAIDQFKQPDLKVSSVINGNAPSQLLSSASTGGGTMTSYQLQAALDAFGNSNSNFQDLGSYVLRKDATGKPVAQTKDQYNTSLFEQQLTAARNAGDPQAFQTSANNLMTLYQKQLLDPNVDPLDKTTITNKVSTLAKSMSKGVGTGGSTKKGKVPVFRIAKVKAVTYKAPKLKTVSQVKLATVKPITQMTKVKLV